MSEANRVAVRIVEETVLGTTPATPAFEPLSITTAPDLAFTPLTVESQTLKSNRKVGDLPLVGAEAGGSVSHEVGFDVMDTLMEGAMFSDWVRKAFRDNEGTADDRITAVSATTFTVTDAAGQNVDFAKYMTILSDGFGDAANNGEFVLDTGSNGTAAVVVGGGMTVDATPAADARIRCVGFEGPSADLVLATGPNRMTSTLVDFTDMGLVVGEWVKVGSGVSGESFATTGLTAGFWARISIIAATALTFDIVPALFGADAGSGKTIRVAIGDSLTEGTTKKSYTIEEEFGDITNLYQYFEGMVVEQLELTFDTQAIVGATTTFQGTNGYFKNDGRFAGSTTLTDITLGNILNTSSNVPRVGEGGVAVSTPNIVQSGSLSINNNLRRITGLGQTGAYDIGAGRSVITGGLSTIFGDETLAEKVINNTESSFDVVFEDVNNGEAILFDAPRTKYSEGAPTVPGIDQDNTVPLSFQALEHSTLGYQLLIQRFGLTT